MASVGATVALSPRLTPAAALACGALAVGMLDLLDAIVFFGMRGATPIRIFQSIASGLLGRAAFQGGIATAILGVAIHFFIAAAIVATFYFAGRRLPWLVHHPVSAGMLYGACVYGVMTYVVVPLSAAGHGPFVLVVFLNGLLIHIFGVGIPAAFFAGLAIKNAR